MNIRDCAGCIYFTKHYGTKNKLGERTASNYWCAKKNGFIRSFPKKCQSKTKRRNENGNMV